MRWSDIVTLSWYFPTGELFFTHSHSVEPKGIGVEYEPVIPERPSHWAWLSFHWSFQPVDVSLRLLGQLMSPESLPENREGSRPRNGELQIPNHVVWCLSSAISEAWLPLTPVTWANEFTLVLKSVSAGSVSLSVKHLARKTGGSCSNSSGGFPV